MPRKTRPHQPGPADHATRPTRNEIEELSPDSLFNTTDTDEPEGDEETVRGVLMGAKIYTGAEAAKLLDAATHGPWRVYSNAVDDGDTADEWTISRGDEVTVARVSADDRDDGSGAEELAASCEADADLIAAAPDLAATVVRLHEECDGLMHAVEVATAERDMLRGVGCGEVDGGELRGPCGACLKCARQERDALRARLAGIVEHMEHGEDCETGYGHPCDCGVADLHNIAKGDAPHA